MELESLNQKNRHWQEGAAPGKTCWRVWNYCQDLHSPTRRKRFILKPSFWCAKIEKILGKEEIKKSRWRKGMDSHRVEEIARQWQLKKVGLKFKWHPHAYLCDAPGPQERVRLGNHYRYADGSLYYNRKHLGRRQAKFRSLWLSQSMSIVTVMLKATQLLSAAHFPLFREKITLIG